MNGPSFKLRHALVGLLLSAAVVAAQPPQGGSPQPEFARQGSQLMREGKLDEALAVYKKELAASPDSLAANRAAGIVLDLMGRPAEAQKYFAKEIEVAPDARAKAAAQRDMAMSYAFAGDCKNTVKYEQMVFDYQVAQKDYFQQGEMANEAARVCIDTGDLDTAAKWYKIGYDTGSKAEPIAGRSEKTLWDYRWEHAQARLAARRGNKAEAQKHVAAAKAALDQIKDQPLQSAQKAFLPYLTGYVAFYSGDYKTALDDLLKANQNDAFIQCLIAQTYEKLGEKDKSMEYYKKASTVTAHNPPAAYARPLTRKKLG